MPGAGAMRYIERNFIIADLLTDATPIGLRERAQKKLRVRNPGDIKTLSPGVKYPVSTSTTSTQTTEKNRAESAPTTTLRKSSSKKISADSLTRPDELSLAPTTSARGRPRASSQASTG